MRKILTASVICASFLFSSAILADAMPMEHKSYAATSSSMTKEDTMANKKEMHKKKHHKHHKHHKHEKKDMMMKKDEMMKKNMTGMDPHSGH